MLCILLHLVITAYFFLKQLMNSHLINTTQYIVVQFLWLGVHLIRLLMIVLPCSRASAEASRTGALVGVVLSTASPYTVAHKQLESFSIQLLHHKVNFNACGLFELGLPLVVSILGAVTTYLVVLLQLKGSPTSPGVANNTAAVLETT
ncbi:gustatory receptor for sugar taste 43a-like [Thrips palmi]|uniref:Gustatory receptor for sugar taste 43a-like n=1 Tax=Thrips palmi TaxID=161013 RepID=A0A6P8ZMP8_THRPL|nr:gustatory receptor for sugar taste 43a-like [Thrips palmi]